MPVVTAADAYSAAWPYIKLALGKWARTPMAEHLVLEYDRIFTREPEIDDAVRTALKLEAESLQSFRIEKTPAELAEAIVATDYRWLPMLYRRAVAIWRERHPA